jgi:hypothetical protein
MHSLALAVLLIRKRTPARTWNVNVERTGDAATIEAAIDLPTDGDTVLVGPGRYYEDFSFLGKDIVIKSLMGPASTILNGSQEDWSIVTFNDGETNEHKSSRLPERGSGRELPYQGMPPGRVGTTRDQLLKLFSCRWLRRANEDHSMPQEALPSLLAGHAGHFSRRCRPRPSGRGMLRS